MIPKPVVVVTSLGRTGTLYWARMFGEVFPNGTSLHEPDILTFNPKQGKGLKFFLHQIEESGFMNKVVKKGVGRFSLIELSDARVRGRLSGERLLKKVRLQRSGFVLSRPGPVYCEASTAYYGLLDLLPRIFARHRAAFIVRDGREWVRSWMNWGKDGGMYSKGPIRRLIAHTWPGAGDLPQDRFHRQWTNMDRFEKICWGWSRLNRYGIEAARKNPSARVVRFEDLFRGEGAVERLEEFIAWMADLPGLTPVIPPAEKLKKKVHDSRGEFPAYEDWSPRQRAGFDDICGDLMRELGYLP